MKTPWIWSGNKKDPIANTEAKNFLRNENLYHADDWNSHKFGSNCDAMKNTRSVAFIIEF